MAAPDEDNIGSGELRSLSWASSKPDYDDMATAVYEFLYGGENSDLENIMQKYQISLLTDCVTSDMMKETAFTLLNTTNSSPLMSDDSFWG